MAILGDKIEHQIGYSHPCENLWLQKKVIIIFPKYYL